MLLPSRIDSSSACGGMVSSTRIVALLQSAAHEQLLRLPFDRRHGDACTVHIGGLLQRRVGPDQIAVVHDDEGGAEIHFARACLVVGEKADVGGAVLERGDHAGGIRRGKNRRTSH